MRDYARDLVTRWEHTAHRSDERLLDTLAFAEGRLLAIHPFRDFNGRTARLFLRELLVRLDLAGISLAPLAPDARATYLAALGSADGGDFRPLIEIWKQRLLAAPLP